mmetsp:Transcript_34008/g.82613  ORF Transcript_34008/g.82613 Transcript_34008/m.82613 type:complete len:291 (-) Transcript_34008:59-931(-)
MTGYAYTAPPAGIGSVATVEIEASESPPLVDSVVRAIPRAIHLTAAAIEIGGRDPEPINSGRSRELHRRPAGARRAQTTREVDTALDAHARKLDGIQRVHLPGVGVSLLVEKLPLKRSERSTQVCRRAYLGGFVHRELRVHGLQHPARSCQVEMVDPVGLEQSSLDELHLLCDGKVVLRLRLALLHLVGVLRLLGDPARAQAGDHRRVHELVEAIPLGLRDAFAPRDGRGSWCWLRRRMNGRGRNLRLALLGEERRLLDGVVPSALRPAAWRDRPALPMARVQSFRRRRG